MTQVPEARDELDLVVAAVCRATAASAGTRTSGAPGDGSGPDVAEPLEALAALQRLREELDGWEPLLIKAARDRGASWASLAPALGVTTRQAAERRYLRLRPGQEPGLTREERVQATRDERAGDRAVAAWARQNASELRQIAGQVSALSGLSTAGRKDAKALATSLTGDDPSSLIQPLADMHAHLVEDHTVLAAQVAAVGDTVGRVRRESQRRRETDALS